MTSIDSDLAPWQSGRAVLTIRTSFQAQLEMLTAVPAVSAAACRSCHLRR